MRFDVIQEGFILDVLRFYTPIKSFYRQNRVLRIRRLIRKRRRRSSANMLRAKNI
jgi:hypothetical protein